MIVIVIISILALIVIPALMSATRQAKESALKADLHILRESVEIFHNDTGAYPQNLNSLISTTSPTRGVDENGNSVTITPGMYKGPYLPPNGGIRGRGIPINPFIDRSITRVNQHWKYTANGGYVNVPDSIADYTTVDGVAFGNL